MTRWGLLLLVAYIALGLSPIDTRRAARYAAGLTAVVLAYVSVKAGSL
ncbi:MAG TPA: hypothetical protein VFW80_12205 [Gaiellaceae bacterium]|nr:hypothetical protein [Gaiellaceae bacterium]